MFWPILITTSLAKKNYDVRIQDTQAAHIIDLQFISEVIASGVLARSQSCSVIFICLEGSCKEESILTPLLFLVSLLSCIWRAIIWSWNPLISVNAFYMSWDPGFLGSWREFLLLWSYYSFTHRKVTERYGLDNPLFMWVLYINQKDWKEPVTSNYLEALLQSICRQMAVVTWVWREFTSHMLRGTHIQVQIKTRLLNPSQLFCFSILGTYIQDLFAAGSFMFTTTFFTPVRKHWQHLVKFWSRNRYYMENLSLGAAVGLQLLLQNKKI